MLLSLTRKLQELHCLEWQFCCCGVKFEMCITASFLKILLMCTKIHKIWNFSFPQHLSVYKVFLYGNSPLAWERGIVNHLLQIISSFLLSHLRDISMVWNSATNKDKVNEDSTKYQYILRLSPSHCRKALYCRKLPVWNFLETGFKKNCSSDEQNLVLCATLSGSPFMTDLQDMRAKEPVAMTDCTQGCFCNQPNT